MDHICFTSEQFPSTLVKCGIYGIRCVPTHQMYVGQSTNIYERWNQHVQAVNMRRHIRQPFQDAARHYAWKAFTFTILEECQRTTLNGRELFWLGQYGSYIPLLGFNSVQEYERLKRIRLILDRSLNSPPEQVPHRKSQSAAH
jgi:hypothetical protein